MTKRDETVHVSFAVIRLLIQDVKARLLNPGHERVFAEISASTGSCVEDRPSSIIRGLVLNARSGEGSHLFQ